MGLEEAEAVWHCVEILTAETIKVWNFRTIHTWFLTSMFHSGAKRYFAGSLATQAHGWRRHCLWTFVVWNQPANDNVYRVIQTLAFQPEFLHVA